VITGNTQATVLVSFLLFVGLSLMLCVMVGPDSDQITDFYTANRSLTPIQNALALSGDYISAATLLGTTGVVAMTGYDGFTLAASTALALAVLLIIARPLRNAGRYTLGDILALRAPGAAPRIASAIATLAVSLPFLIVQMSGAGSATAQLLGLTAASAQQVCTVLVGALMICYTALGGMRGASLVQIIKVVLGCAAVIAVALSVLARFHWNIDSLLAAARAGSGHGAAFLRPGLQLGTSTAGRLDSVGLQLTVVLGAACMPHMVMRVNASPTGTAARRSARYAVVIVAVFCLLISVIGLGAAGLLGDRVIGAVNPNGQGALMLIAAQLDGGIGTTTGTALFTAVACAVFVTVLAVVAGATLAAAAGLAHDLHSHVVHRGRLPQAQEVRSVRWSVVGIGLVAIALAIAIQGYNVQFLISLALTMAASAILPAILYSLFWPRYNRTGLLWTVYVGLMVSAGLQAFSPTVSGTPFALFPHADFHWFPLQSPGLISVPAGFAAGWLGSKLHRPSTTPGQAAAIQERVLVGEAE
jgi:SSS family solute:Na+ symporter/cation/acetate symporter